MNERNLFLSHVAQTSDFPLMLEIERAEGICVYAKDGKRYIDLISGIAVNSVGHRHPKVVEAIKEQLDRYLHVMVYGEYVQSPQVQLAHKLTSLLPKPLDSVYFTNSGAEAVEGSLKLAKRFTRRSEIISCYNSYHGSTHGALSVMGNEVYKNAFRPLLPGITFIRFGNADDLELINHKTACVIIEPIQGEAGVRLASKEYFAGLRKRCDETGTLLIFDEAQTGFGRTGKLFAFQHYFIVPDILILAKGMGGGMPIGAFVSSNEIMSSFKSNPILGHITTFGGHPVSCAAALATLNVIINEKLTESADEKEAWFVNLLVHPIIKEVRSKGLMIAVEFESFDLLKSIIDCAIEKGVITDWFLHCNNSMRIAPPLTISKEEVYESCEVILEAISSF